MANRKEAPAARPPASRFALFPLLCSILWISALAGCAAPGEPHPPRPPVPEAVTDLAGQQFGDSVVLTFTLPESSVEGVPLAAPPQIEIYRDFVPAGATPPQQLAPKALVYTIPSAVVDTYLIEGRVRFADPLPPENVAQHEGQQVVYLVRTRASKRKDSADSNLVAVQLHAVPQPISAISVTVTEEAIELRWQPPEETATGAAVAPPVDYRIYRAEVAPGGETEAARNPSQAKLAVPPALLGVTPTPSYRDTQFQFGRTYLYTVRSVEQYGAESVESADSAPGVVTPRDTFPPAAPKDLVVVTVAGTSSAPAHLELSWAISPEPDLAGYNVYRSEQEGTGGQRQNHELLLTPTFRDMSVVAGQRYSYKVTAVDRAGNVSLPSAAVSAVVPSESEKENP
jgi:hypothetical protein